MSRSRSRQHTIFFCQECGHESPRWMGFCPAPSCNSTLPLVEAEAAVTKPGRPGWVATETEPVQELSQLSLDGQARIEFPSQELNRVLGGGLVPGSVVLLAGEPGVGKSTLLLQIAQFMSSSGESVLYVSGEESPQQIKLRSERLGFDGEGVFLLAETDVGQVVNRLEERRPALAIVDSIQTLYSQDVPSGPGSVVQVREAGLRLMRWAKMRHVPVFLAGHVTKDGTLAGPRVLEHMVDVVTYLESQDFSTYRVLRSEKNRFGPTTEVGVFEMTGQGLAEVPDPSRTLLSQRYDRAVGAALVPVLEGSRPLMLEVQALTSPSQLPIPRRVANGVDHNRLLMLTAVAGRVGAGRPGHHRKRGGRVPGRRARRRPGGGAGHRLQPVQPGRGPGTGGLRRSGPQRRAAGRAPNGAADRGGRAPGPVPLCLAGDGPGRAYGAAGSEVVPGPDPERSPAGRAGRGEGPAKRGTHRRTCSGARLIEFLDRPQGSGPGGIANVSREAQNRS